MSSGCGKPTGEPGNSGEDVQAEPAEGQRPPERAAPPPEADPNVVVWRGPEPPTAPEAGDVWLSPKNSKEMVYVSAGEFLRGSREWEGDSDERPQREVCLDAYWMDKTEVTNAEYRRFCEATGHKKSNYWRDSRYSQPLQPVVGVSWGDASAYAKWAGKRLPTEAEWEKAARGEDGRKYPWGNEEPSSRHCNMRGSGEGHEYAAPVGSFPTGTSSYGCLDMAGSVWEWCADRYDEDYYSSAPSRNPKGPDSGENRVVRGGSWNNDSDFGRCANRGYFPPSDRYYLFFGFRCTRDAR
jgi:iron(II)-dependent oxidoreductase